MVKWFIITYLEVSGFITKTNLVLHEYWWIIPIDIVNRNIWLTYCSIGFMKVVILLVHILIWTPWHVFNLHQYFFIDFNFSMVSTFLLVIATQWSPLNKYYLPFWYTSLIMVDYKSSICLISDNLVYIRNVFWQ